MPKTEKELQELKAKFDDIKKDLGELTDDELNEVAGGFIKTPLSFDKTNAKGTCPTGCTFSKTLGKCVCKLV